MIFKRTRMDPPFTVNEQRLEELLDADPDPAVEVDHRIQRAEQAAEARAEGMSNMPSFERGNVECPKCGYDTAGVEYGHARVNRDGTGRKPTELFGEPLLEGTVGVIWRDCRECGYEWPQRPLDYREPKPEPDGTLSNPLPTPPISRPRVVNCSIEENGANQ